MNNKLWHAIVDISPVQFSVYDLLKESLVFSSGLAEKVLDVDSETLKQLSHEHFKELIYPEDFSAFQNNLKSLRNSDKLHSVQSIFRMKKKDGHHLWVRSRHTVYERNKYKQPTKLLSAAEDISEIKSLEESLSEKVAHISNISHLNAQALRSEVAAIVGLVRLINESVFIDVFDKMILEHLKDTILKLDEMVAKYARTVHDSNK